MNESRIHNEHVSTDHSISINFKPGDKSQITNNSINKRCDTNNELFYKWNFGTINIRTGDEKSKGARIYMIAKQVAEAKLLVCSYKKLDTVTMVNKLSTWILGRVSCSIGVVLRSDVTMGLEL